MTKISHTSCPRRAGFLKRLLMFKDFSPDRCWWKAGSRVEIFEWHVPRNKNGRLRMFGKWVAVPLFLYSKGWNVYMYVQMIVYVDVSPRISGTQKKGTEPYSRLFCGWTFPYLSRIIQLIYRWGVLHFRGARSHWDHNDPYDIAEPVCQIFLYQSVGRILSKLGPACQCLEIRDKRFQTFSYPFSISFSCSKDVVCPWRSVVGKMIFTFL